MIRLDSLLVWAPRVLSIMRIMAALLFLEHGTQKLFNFPPGPNHPAFFTLNWWQAIIELVGGGASCAWVVYAAGRFHSLRRHGRGLFHVACAAEFLPGGECGRFGDPLLLHLLLHLLRRSRRPERRCDVAPRAG